MKYAQIGPIATHFPARSETSDQLRLEHPEWEMEVIEEKTGIHRRYVVGPEETAADLGVAAAEKLFDRFSIDRQSVDFLLLCTQTPDYPLPTTSCLMQERLGLATRCGALDYNLGCSGFVYGVALADGLIQSGAARRVLLITSETYSKYIDADDRSLRTIFGDGAAATLIEEANQPSIWGAQFGTDGSGANTLLVADGGARLPAYQLKPRHRKRWKSRLYMDGPSLINFTIDAVPRLVDEILARTSLTIDDIDLFVFHQATRKMLEQLQQRLHVDDHRLPIRLADVGNTVSATIPILIDQLRREGRMTSAKKNIMVGFGVGWSWAGCVWQDTWMDQCRT